GVVDSCIGAQPLPSVPAGRTILVVEDDDPIRGVMRDLLLDAGYTVVEANNGRAALAAMEHARPDLIVLDLWMPQMDGWTLRREQLARPELAAVPVIVSSASRDLRP